MKTGTYKGSDGKWYETIYIPECQEYYTHEVKKVKVASKDTK